MQPDQTGLECRKILNRMLQPDQTGLLLWSSYSKPAYSDSGLGGYTVAIARSAGGSMEGPWTHDDKLFMDRNAGHSSLFRSLDGTLMMATHYPDTPHGQERPLFIPLREEENGLSIAER